MSTLWSIAERAAWREPDTIKPSEWAERYRFLPASQTANAGPWDNEFMPPLRGIMDLPAAAGVKQVNIMKAAQLGVSEAIRNFIGWAADVIGDPVGLALPDKSKGRKILGNRIIPMIRETPRLARHCGSKLHDLSKEQVRLAKIGWLLHLMWSGSPSSLSSEPLCYSVNDEVDYFAPWAGAAAAPVEMTYKRLRSYAERGRQVNISTPTTRFGTIHGLWDGSDVKLYFFVPCPKCDTYQRLQFANLRWKHSDHKDKRKKAAAAMRGGAWYECASCEHKIREADRPKMMSLGRWATEDGEITDAESITEWPAGTTIGIQISALYCAWTAWNEIAGEFLLATGDLSKMFDFRTQTLGEPFEQQIEHTKTDFFREKCKRAKLPEGVVPKWAAKLLCTIDSQQDHFWAVVRAWGPDMRSARVWHGRVETFQALDKLIFHDRWRVEDDAWPAPRIELTLIDTGGTKIAGENQSRTMEVYRWVHGRRGHVIPLKGSGDTRKGQSYWWGKAWIDDGIRRRKKKTSRPELRLLHVCTGHFRDELYHWMNLGIGDPDLDEAWDLNTRQDDEYAQHLANMNKITLRRGINVVQEWKPVGSGLRHDLHDCETYQLVAAHVAQVHALPSSDEFMRLRAARQAASAIPRSTIPDQDTLQEQALDSWSEHL